MIISTKDLAKIYHLGKIEVPALKGININIEKGEFVAIMGASGSGKSTLMHLIGCLDRPSSGTITIDGIETSHMEKDELAELRNKKIGFVFQSFNLLPRMNALGNVELPLLYANIPKEKRREKAINAMKMVNLEDRMNHKPSELSGGQQQRVAIARALINSPAIILADEPTGNLDSKSGVEIIGILRKLNEEGHTVIMVTHDRNVGENVRRIIILKDGEVTEEVDLSGKK